MHCNDFRFDLLTSLLVTVKRFDIRKGQNNTHKNTDQPIVIDFCPASQKLNGQLK